MPFTKITDDDRAGKGTVGMADTPNLTAAEMQAKFDELSNLSIDKFNVHVDEESATSAAANIGAVDPTTGGNSVNVQGVLDNLHNKKQEKENGKGLSANDFTDTYKTELDTAYENNHTHANKSVLDLITSTVKNAYDRLVTLFTSITSITTTVNGSDTALPTAGAISRYVQQMGGGDMVKSIYDTDNDGIVDRAEVADSLSNPIAATAVTYSHTASGLSAEDAQAAIDEVHNEAKNSVQTSAIEDDLLGTDATKVLSAPQGKVLDGKITTINSKISNFGTIDYSYANVSVPIVTSGVTFTITRTGVKLIIFSERIDPNTSLNIAINGIVMRATFNNSGTLQSITEILTKNLSEGDVVKFYTTGSAYGDTTAQITSLN